MAKFTQDVKETNDPNYLGQSKGTDPLRPNRMYESLFEGLGDLVEGGAKTIDQANLKGIEKDVYAGVDAIRGEHGVDAAVEMQKTPVVPPLVPNDDQGNPLPPAIDQNARRQMEGMTQAFNEGKMTDTQYFTKLTALSKSIRSKYPGYRSEVDQMIRHVAGIDPANSLRAELLQVWEKGQREAASKRDDWQKFLDKNAEWLPDGYETMDQTEIRKHVYDAQRVDRGIKDGKQRLELRAAQGKLTGEIAEQEAGQIVSMTINQSLDRGLDAIGFNKLQSRLLEFQKTGKAPSQDEQNQLNAGFIQLETELTNRVMADLTRTIKGQNGEATSLMKIIGPEKVQKMVETALIPVRQMKEAIYSKDYGTVGMLARQIQNQKDEDLASFRTKVPLARVIETVRQAGGPELAALVFGSGENMTKLQQGVKDYTNSVLLGGDSTQTYGSAVDTLIKDPNAKRDPKAIATSVKTASTLVTNPAVPIELREQAAKQVFNKDFARVVGYFSQNDGKDSKLRVFESFINDATTKTMTELKTKNPELWNNYKEAAKEAFNALFKSETDTIRGFNARDLEIKWDDGKGQFVATPKGGSSGFFSANPAVVYAPQLRAVDRFNRAFSQIKGLIQAEGGDVATELQGFLDLKKQGKEEDNIWSSMWNALKSGAKSLVDDENANAAKRVLQKGGEGKENPKKDQRSDAGGLSLYTDEELKNVAFRTDDNDEEVDFSGVGGRVLRTAARDPENGLLLDLIQQSEARGGYNTIFGGRQVPLDKMTVAQAMDLQGNMRAAGSPSTAIGGGQFIAKTLRGLVKAGVVDPDEKMTQAVQERMMIALLKGRGLDKWRRGEMSDEDFMHEVSKEWAGLPSPKTGRSFYAGDGLNKANTSVRNFARILASIKKGDTLAQAKVDDTLSME